ncbi:MAG: tyrosine-type recombinase/integrase, partial [Alphaproteobacteria bacterium]|nr:tyrosine-type recombinase/integrase [Alphaproteobacteria bacterium]
SYMGKKVASIKKSFKGACLKAELKNVSPHTLRHTAATWAAQNGATIFDIAGILGQSVVQITERYAKHQPEHLRSAVWSILRKRSPVGK